MMRGKGLSFWGRLLQQRIIDAPSPIEGKVSVSFSEPTDEVVVTNAIKQVSMV